MYFDQRWNGITSKNHDYKVLPDFKACCGDMGSARQMEMIYPQPNSKIYVPLEITGERGKTIFTASHRKPGMKIFWHLDGNFVGTTVNFHQIALSPVPGNHTLTIVDEGGNSIMTGFEILEAVRKKG